MNLKEGISLIVKDVKNRIYAMGWLTICLILVLYVGWGREILSILSQIDFFKVVLSPENSWTFASLFCTAVLIVVYLLRKYYIKRQGKFGNFIIGAAIFAAFVWADCRFFTNGWKYEYIPGTLIAYFDILVIIPIFF